MKRKYEIGENVSVRAVLPIAYTPLSERITFKLIHYIDAHCFSEFALADTTDSCVTILPDIYTQSLSYRLYTCEWDAVLFNKNDEMWG